MPDDFALPRARRPLRIFYAAPGTPNSLFKGIASSLWRTNLLLPLKDLGHDVVEFQYDLDTTFKHLNLSASADAEFIRTNRPQLSEELVAQVKAAHARKPIDVLFSYFYTACVLPEALAEIRKLGICTVNWYCNGSYQLELVAEIAPHYDFCLVPEKFRLEDYRKLGARPIYCQEAANPNFYKPAEVTQDHDITFIGQCYGDRPEIVRHAYERGVEICCYGLYWRPRHVLAPTDARGGIPERLRNDLLTDEQLVAMISRSKINLGFSSCGSTHETGHRILQVRLRDFEIPMSGGFYMTEHMEELAEFFTPDQEIVMYRDRNDMVEKMRYYLAHADKRRAIAQAGYERARREHTWHRRFEDSFRQMGL